MILLILPNQLFAKHPGLQRDPSRIILLEDSLFFGDKQYPMRFHKQKLWLHRATMKRYEADLRDDGYEVQYVEYDARETIAGRPVEAVDQGKGTQGRDALLDRSDRFRSGKAVAARLVTAWDSTARFLPTRDSSTHLKKIRSIGRARNAGSWLTSTSGSGSDLTF